MAQKKFSSEFKAKVAIEALKGHKTTNELALEFEVHLTQMNRISSFVKGFFFIFFFGNSALACIILIIKRSKTCF